MKIIPRIISLSAVAAMALILTPHAMSEPVCANQIIPLPQSVKPGRGSFAVEGPQSLRFYVQPTAGGVLAEQLKAQGLMLTDKRSANVNVSVKPSADTESYRLTITPKGVTIVGGGEAGAAYGVQSLLQMARLAAETGNKALKACVVVDAPRFPYRGLHFDVSRHFRSIDFLKKQIDAMAALKMNRFHLHFTDGAGWRMPVDAYPRLTSYAAWRPERSWQEWRNNGTRYCDETDPRAQGGYYTKEQLRDLVKYAADRNITVIPEIEMPGHSEEVVAAYPEVSCNGRGSDLCPGKEKTFEFLQTVLDETIDIFPSRLIHIGGDEATKEQWKDCPDCQRRMADEGLKNVDELQSYMIKRIEKYLQSKGREIIGWDEILDGGVAPGATVMAWRGTEAGKRAMADGHDVIMTPGEYCYIDYTQDAPYAEPVSIGGYTPLSKVYSYEPVDSTMTPEQARHLLGVQANLWSEYVTEDSHAEHMYYPRAYAIAEIGWSPAGKDYDDFHSRALAFNRRMAADGYSVFDLDNEKGERPESLEPVSHMARGARVTYANPYSQKYTAAGDATLTDGKRGGWSHGGGLWQGFTDDVDLTVDLGAVRPVRYIDAAFLHSEGAWIQLPDRVTYEVSTDGRNFKEAAVITCDMDPTYPKTMVKNYGAAVDTSARYVRVRATQNPRPGAWLFMDEVIIN